MKPDFMRNEIYNKKDTKSSINGFCIDGNSPLYFINNCEKNNIEIKYTERPYKTNPKKTCKEYLVSDLVCLAQSMGLEVSPEREKNNNRSIYNFSEPKLNKIKKDLINDIYNLTEERFKIQADIERMQEELDELAPFVMTSKSTGYTMPSINDIVSNQVFVSEGLACGVYFLLKDDKVVYVGQSINVHSRVQTHISDKSKDFDSFSFVMCKKQDLNKVESLYINFFDPKYNITKPSLWL